MKKKLSKRIIKKFYENGFIGRLINVNFKF